MGEKTITASELTCDRCNFKTLVYKGTGAAEDWERTSRQLPWLASNPETLLCPACIKSLEEIWEDFWTREND